MTESHNPRRPSANEGIEWAPIALVLGVVLIVLVALMVWKPSLFDFFGSQQKQTVATSTTRDDQDLHPYRLVVRAPAGESVKGALLRAATDTSEAAVTGTSDEQGNVTVSLPVSKNKRTVYHVVVEPPQGNALQKAVYDIQWNETDRKWLLQGDSLTGLKIEGDLYTVTLSDGAPRSPGNQMAQGTIPDVRGSYIRADGIRTTEEGITVLLANGFIKARSDVSCTWETSFTRKGVVEAFRDGVSMGMTNVIDLRPQAGALCEMKRSTKVSKDISSWFFVEAKCGNVVHPPMKQPPITAPPQQPTSFSVTARAQHSLPVFCPAPRQGVLITTVTGIGTIESGFSRNTSVNVATVEAQNDALNRSLPAAIADAEAKRAEVLRNTQLLSQICGFDTPNLALFTGAAIAPFSATINCAPFGNQLVGSGTVVVSSANIFGNSLASIQSTFSQADANARAQVLAAVEASRQQRLLEDRAQSNRDSVCGTMSQPSFAKDPISADKTEGSTTQQGGTFTVTGSDAPTRPPPNESNFTNPVQGTNPEPRDSDSTGGSSPPPAAPSPSSKPTSPNGPLR